MLRLSVGSREFLSHAHCLELENSEQETGRKQAGNSKGQDNGMGFWSL